jgi:Na+/melibiose symporter-like transporter
MNFKKLGKRLLYFIGGIVIVFISSIFLAVYIEGGGQWFSQGAIYLYVAILFGIGVFLASLFPKLNEPPKPKVNPDKNPDDTGTSKTN